MGIFSSGRNYFTNSAFSHYVNNPRKNLVCAWSGSGVVCRVAGVERSLALIMQTHRKIELERLIFDHAARLGARISAVGGRYRITWPIPAQIQPGSFAARRHSAAALCALVGVYNRFFAAENRRFLHADRADTRAQLRAWVRPYQQQEKRQPLRPGFHLCCQK